MSSVSPPVVKGINVIGHLSSSSGLGHTARLLIGILRSRGYQVAGLDIDPLSNSETTEPVDWIVVSEPSRLPFDHNLVVVSMNRLPQLWVRRVSAILNPRFKNAGMVFWELPVFPAPWLPSLRMFDAVLVCSHYVRQAFEADIRDVPTVFAEHPLGPSGASEREAIRKRFDIATDGTVFCCSFDPRSDVARKNPAGAIVAWLRAFPADPNVSLVIKTNGHIDGTQLTPDLREAVALAKVDPRIRFIEARLTNAEIQGLYDCCDVIISLHRSEGLGLVPMEAMALGKLVVATGYSGNMTFMTEQNSMPVMYRLIPAVSGTAYLNKGFAGKNACWADPDIDHASRLLRLAMEDPDLRRRLGQQARADIAKRQETARAGDYLDWMTAYLTESTRHSLRPMLKRQILFHEIFNPTLFAKNITGLWANLKRRTASRTVRRRGA